MADWFHINMQTPEALRGCDNKTHAGTWFTLLQEIATEHCDALACIHGNGLPDGLMWILLGVQISWHEHALITDMLHIKTAPSAHTHGLYQRRTFIFNDKDEPIADGIGYWTLMDGETRRLTRNDYIRAKHDEATILSPIRQDAFEPLLGGRAYSWSYTPDASDVDDNGHVNNARYASWLEDALCTSLNKPICMKRVSVRYASEVLLHENITGRILYSDDNRFTFEIFRALSDRACFTASGCLV